MRLHGCPVALQGLRHGTISCSSKLMIFSVTMAYVSICSAPFLRPLPRRGRATWVLVWFLAKPTFPPRASHHVRRPEGGKDPTRSEAELPMSGAEQFKAAVSERSGPQDWRGGLERERRKAG